jgi:uncharacterized protein
VRILLPPSEAKRPGGAVVEGESEPGRESPLAQSRATVASALVDFCHRDPAGAARSLVLPPRSESADLAMNRAVSDAPRRAALDRYAGTVYEGFDVATLTTAGRRRALESVLIFSGLFGVLRADEPIPAYRLPVAATLPTVGALTPYWRAVLRAEMDQLLDDSLIIDLRSGDYAAMWRPAAAVRDQVVPIRIVSEQPSGRLAVISYPSKYGKGRLARALVSSRARITAPDDVADRWMDAGGRDVIVGPGGRLDLLSSPVTSSPLASR